MKIKLRDLPASSKKPPGINPSAEFLGTVKARDLYPKLMESVAAFAKSGGYDAVLIPTEKNIHSNRGDISVEIKRAKYETRTLATAVTWNSSPSPYPFSEVYVAWEKGASPPHSALNDSVLLCKSTIYTCHFKQYTHT